MTLDLTTDQPAEAAIAPEPVAAPDAPPIIATLVTADGVVVRISERPDGAIALIPSGNRAPLLFDRFQANALRDVLGVEV
jgi:hypothetical protein